MKRRIQILIILFTTICIVNESVSQGLLRTDGKKIVDTTGTEIILRGMGLGGWMLQEGYMMQTSGFANTQHELKEKITALIGEEGMHEFYDAWLTNYIQKPDVDSMAKWGFNSLRLPLHYNLFTLPIEDEPVEGENTWINKGFELTDSLLSWCEANQIYLILDLHAAPGGQGYDEAISDYDPDKPSLWESAENRNKTVAFWQKLAERYANEEWIGGYDLLNETNWNLSGNILLRNLYYEITDSIRAVDTSHIIFIEGNWFANDFNGLTPPWDDNMVYSFHKYWTYNDIGSIQWMIDMRNQYNIPIWLGESGENSNTWFYECIKLLEENGIGWAWWPYKKIGSVSCPFTIVKTAGYDSLINYWNNGDQTPDTVYAKQVLMDLAEKLKSKNCDFHPDVIDAMFRQIESEETLAFTTHIIPGVIHFSDFDLGRNEYAYSDQDVANYNLSTGNYVTWNKGWSYRNDGVDIEIANDTLNSNGYNVGWTNSGEWMQYSINTDSEFAYTLDIRSAAQNIESVIHFEINDIAITEYIDLPITNSWQNWNTSSVENIILPEGKNRIRLLIDEPGSNLSYFQFKDPISTDGINFMFLAAKTYSSGNNISITLNKDITDINEGTSVNDFTVWIDNEETILSNLSLSENSNRVLILELDEVLLYDQVIEISYNGSSIMAGDQYLESFEKTVVRNIVDKHFDIPGRIEAEEFTVNHGLEIENCEDTGGGYNMGYADVGDYLDYKIYVENSGLYKVDYRLATEASNSKLIMMVGENESFVGIDTITIENTGGWQNWNTQRSEVVLNAGLQTLRIYVKRGPFNLNWFRFGFISSAESVQNDQEYGLYPNPTNNRTILCFKSLIPGDRKVKIIDINGRLLFSCKTKESSIKIETDSFKKGIYFVFVNSNKKQSCLKLIIY